MIDFEGTKWSTIQVERGVFVATSVLLVAIMGMVGSMAKDMMGHAVMNICMQSLYNLWFVFLSVVLAVVLRMYSEIFFKQGQMLHAAMFFIRMLTLLYSMTLLTFTFQALIIGITKTLGATVNFAIPPFFPTFGF